MACVGMCECDRVLFIDKPVFFLCIYRIYIPIIPEVFGKINVLQISKSNKNMLRISWY